MNINERKPEDVLKPEFIQAYEELHKDIWFRLVEINVTITILEKVQNFPYHRFLGSPDNIFWPIVLRNFQRIAIVLLHALVEDQETYAHTLKKFKNKIYKEWLKDSEKKIYSDGLKKAKFKHTTDMVLKKIKDMRHQLIAHRLLDKNGHLSSPHGITVSEIRSAYNDVERLFHMCSFGAEYICTFYINKTVGGKPIEKDIDYIFDLIVKDSNWLNKPERNPIGWQCVKGTITEGEIAELNRWREKFGLPAV